MEKIYKLAILLSLLFSGQVLAQTDALKLRIDGNNYSDETIIRFAQGATADFDGDYDAWKMFSINTQVPAIYTQIDSVSPLSINALPELVHKWTIDLYTDIHVAGTYTFTPQELGPFQPGVCISLEDISTGNYYDLRSGQQPSFTLPVTTGSAPRFRVHFITPATVTVTNASCFQQTNGEAILAKPGTTGWSYTLTDGEGSLVASRTGINQEDTVTGLAAGTYTMNAVTPAGCSEITSFEVQQPDPLQPAFTVSDTSVYLSQATLQFVNTTLSGAACTWDFGDGSPVCSTASPSHTYTSAGNYTVTLTASNGSCIELASRAIHVEQDPLVTSVGNIQGSEAPSIVWNGNIVEIGNASSALDVSVRNMLGQEVMAGKVNPNNSKASMKLDVPSGYYVVTVSGGGRIAFKKIFIPAE
jgi:PKD repeat protein